MVRDIKDVLREKRDNETLCILKNKRRLPNRNGKFVCEVACAACGNESTVAFSGWTATSCQECGRMMHRLPYMKKPVYEEVFAMGFAEGMKYALEPELKAAGGSDVN